MTDGLQGISDTTPETLGNVVETGAAHGEDLKTPDVKNVTLDSLRSKAKLLTEDGVKDMPQAAATPSADDDDAEIVEVPTDDGSTPKHSPQKATEKAEAEDEGGKEIVKPWARARILEKERDRAEVRVNDLESRLTLLATAMEQLASSGIQAKDASAAPDDKKIDPDIDPVGALLQEVRSVREEVKSLKADRDTDKARSSVAAAVSSVDGRLQEQFKSDPVFVEALNHVAKVVGRTAEKKYPNATKSQLAQQVANQFAEVKASWAAEGRDPVTEMYDMAMTLGFDPDAVESRIKAEKPEARAKAAPKEKIAQ